MKEYPKIDSVFKRDPENNYKTFLDEYVTDVFRTLRNCEWRFREKIDGRNHRVLWDGEEIEHRGRTDKAHFSDEMLETVEEIFTPEKMFDVFGDNEVCLYGELYGAGINGGGSYIPDGLDFILFDVLIDGWWIKREDMEGMAKGLDIDVCPIVGTGTIEDAVELCKETFQSKIADCKAEGLIMVPVGQLFDRKGKRVITKLKFKDFQDE